MVRHDPLNAYRLYIADGVMDVIQPEKIVFRRYPHNKTRIFKNPRRLKDTKKQIKKNRRAVSYKNIVRKKIYKIKGGSLSVNVSPENIEKLYEQWKKEQVNQLSTIYKKSQPENKFINAKKQYAQIQSVTKDYIKLISRYPYNLDTGYNLSYVHDLFTKLANYDYGTSSIKLNDTIKTIALKQLRKTPILTPDQIQYMNKILSINELEHIMTFITKQKQQLFCLYGLAALALAQYIINGYNSSILKKSINFFRHQPDTLQLIDAKSLKEKIMTLFNVNIAFENIFSTEIPIIINLISYAFNSDPIILPIEQPIEQQNEQNEQNEQHNEQPIEEQNESPIEQQIKLTPEDQMKLPIEDQMNLPIEDQMKLPIEYKETLLDEFLGILYAEIQQTNKSIILEQLKKNDAFLQTHREKYKKLLALAENIAKQKLQSTNTQAHIKYIKQVDEYDKKIKALLAESKQRLCKNDNINIAFPTLLNCNVINFTILNSNSQA